MHIDFRNSSGLVFQDISSEDWREYRFPNGGVVRINEPLRLNISEHGHRIFSADGVSHYVPFGWIELVWQAHEGAPHFAF